MILFPSERFRFFSANREQVRNSKMSGGYLGPPRNTIQKQQKSEYLHVRLKISS